MSLLDPILYCLLFVLPRLAKQQGVIEIFGMLLLYPIQDVLQSLTP